MAAFLPVGISQNGTRGVQRLPEMSEDGTGWYFSRKEIEENSPSKRDGIDWKKEAYLRRSYCTFLQDLGKRLKVPQVTIATAIIFCHRFYLRHSLGRKDRRIIATVCMFLAAKVEETPHPLKDVVLVSYEFINKDPVAAQRIKQKEVYEEQKALILAGETMVLQTLGFDLILHHPYKPLVEGIKKLQVAQNALAQVAWNFVNDGLRTSLCLQFQPHHIAAGAIFLASKFLKVKLPSHGEKHWWQEFDVTPRQLEEVSNEILELYEENQVLPSRGAMESGASSWAAAKVTASNGENIITNSYSHTGVASSRIETSNHDRSSDYGGRDMKQGLEDEAKGNNHIAGRILQHQENLQEELRSQSGYGEEQGNYVGRNEMNEASKNVKQANRNPDHRDSTRGRPPQEVIKKMDRDQAKGALEKRRKAFGHITKKTEVIVDEDDLIDRELEDGIELNWSKPSDRSENGNFPLGRHRDHGYENRGGINNLSSSEHDLTTVEEGEVSLKSGNSKRKASTSPDRALEMKPRYPNNCFDYTEDQKRVQVGW